MSPTDPQHRAQSDFKKNLNRLYLAYTAGFVLLVFAVGVLERWGLSRHGIGYIFLATTVVVYAGIGMMSRTSDPEEYYAAGRRVPPFYNGMATGADWMSAASLISMAGTLYFNGFMGLAFVMGWTGGYCLLALLHCCSHPICASLPASRSLIFWARVTTGISRAPLAHWVQLCAPSLSSWRRFMASG